VYGDDLELASYLRIEERELEARGSEHQDRGSIHAILERHSPAELELHERRGERRRLDARCTRDLVCTKRAVSEKGEQLLRARTEIRTRWLPRNEIEELEHVRRARDRSLAQPEERVRARREGARPLTPCSPPSSDRSLWAEPTVLCRIRRPQIVVLTIRGEREVLSACRPSGQRGSWPR